MLRVKPETYNEIVRAKQCYDLTSYYKLSEEQLQEIYDFLGESKSNSILGYASQLSFRTFKGVVKTMTVTRKNFSFSSITVTSTALSVVALMTYSRSYGGGSSSRSRSSSSSGGWSSNNNNNKNNNNNNNNNNN